MPRLQSAHLRRPILPSTEQMGRGQKFGVVDSRMVFSWAMLALVPLVVVDAWKAGAAG